jgi:hypothetical protein
VTREPNRMNDALLRVGVGQDGAVATAKWPRRVDAAHSSLQSQ